MTKDEALKLALEALENAADAIDSWGSYASGYFQVKHDLENDISKARKAITAIKEALAQPEQEPVAYGMWDTQLGRGGRMMLVRLDKGQDGCTVPLYTTPPQRKPLTDQMTKQMRESCDSYEMRGAFVDGWLSAEAAHGIKGEA